MVVGARGSPAGAAKRGGALQAPNAAGMAAGARESDRRYNFADPRPLLKSFFLRDEPTPSFHTRHWAEGARGGGHGRGPHRVTPVSFKFFHHMCLLARMRVVQVLVRSRRVPPRAQSIPCGSPRKAGRKHRDRVGWLCGHIMCGLVPPRACRDAARTSAGRTGRPPQALFLKDLMTSLNVGASSAYLSSMHCAVSPTRMLAPASALMVKRDLRWRLGPRDCSMV